MARLSVRRVLLISAVFALVAVSLGALALLPAARDRELRQAEAFAREVERRFEAGNGLWACERVGVDDRDQIPRVAQRALSALGEPVADVTMVIAPSFGEVGILQIDRHFVRGWSLPGRTGFGPAFPPLPRPEATPSPDNGIPPHPGWFTVTPQGGSRRDIPPFEVDVALATLIRHISFPSAPRRVGRDGVSYYFLAGTGECAQTWSPMPGGQSQRLLDLVGAISAGDFEEARTLARQIDLADGAPPTWRESLEALLAGDPGEDQ